MSRLLERLTQDIVLIVIILCCNAGAVSSGRSKIFTLKEIAVAAERLELEHQVSDFHLLRWSWHALEKVRPQLDEAHQDLIDQIWRLAKERPTGAQVRLFAIWKKLQVRRAKETKTSALHRLRLLVLRLQETGS